MSKVATQIRLSEDIYAKVKCIANAELRSLNAQMEYFIIKGIESYEADNGLTITSQPDGSCKVTSDS
jgi:hypothetical protein